MTDQEIIDYYAELLILQYREKPKAFAHIQTLVTPLVMDQLPKQVEDAFSVENAVGAQLDIIGKYVGVSRTNGAVSLDDDGFRVFIQLAIIKNSAGSSLAEIQALIYQFFADEIFVFDFKTMRMGYYIDVDAWTDDLATIAIQEDLLPYPMAIQRSSNIYADATTLTTFFGFRTYLSEGYNNSPFNTYDDYQAGRPWLSYNYAVYDNTPEYSLLLEDGSFLLQESGFKILL
jgi:hypothetical protein